MFDDVITLFIKYEDKKNKLCQWHSKVIANVELQKNNAIAVSKDGNKSNDTVKLHIPCKDAVIGEYEYLKPKEWYKAADKADKITLKEGDFFVDGEVSDLDIYEDSQYQNGLFSYMKTNFDDVYVISSVDIYKTIPHFEVGGH